MLRSNDATWLSRLDHQSDRASSGGFFVPQGANDPSFPSSGLLKTFGYSNVNQKTLGIEKADREGRKGY
jgi:hypothetical protein